MCGPFVKETPPGLVAGRKTGVPWASAAQFDALTKMVMNNGRVAGLLGAWCWGLVACLREDCSASVATVCGAAQPLLTGSAGAAIVTE